MNSTVFSRKTINNIIKVAATNIFKLAAGILVGFLLPKIIGVTDYGYYKTFTLYASYTGLLHFGFADGIYLKYGGKKFEDLNKQSFRLFSSFLIIFEVAVTIFFCFFSFFVITGELKFVFLCLAIFTLSSNIVYYYQIISQITERFTELSLRNLIQSILTIVSILFLFGIFLFTKELLSYRIYTLIYVFITAFLTIWYVWTYRDITFGKKDSLFSNKKEIFFFFRIGFPLLIANLCQSLILSIDRQFVNIFFDIETYAIYAFAYNLLALITTALSAISTVIYPVLKKTDEESLKNIYPFLIEIVLIIVSFCILLFFPISLFIEWFLPKYTVSIQIFRIVLPGLAISSSITLIMHNYYKVINKEGLFFIKSICILLISIIANFIAYSIFGTIQSISISSIIVMIIWYLISEEYFVVHYKVKWTKNLIYMFLIIFSFYFITVINTWWLALIVYLLVFAFATLFLFGKDLNKIKDLLFNSK